MRAPASAAFLNRPFGPKRIPLVTMVIVLLLALLLSVNAQADKAGTDPELPSVRVTTSEGVFHIQLRPDYAPRTVENFLQYVDDGFYDGTVFHRVIDAFMVQGGGFDQEFRQKSTREPVVNESRQTAPNLRGSIAMARTADPDSATAQFFINVTDNRHLNASANRPGYTVFGKVTEGMGVIDAIAQVQTGVRNNMGDVPLESVVIESVRRIGEP